METVDAFEQVKDFMNEELGPHFKGKLTRTTSIEGDLKITGDDADDFLESFVKKFNINADEFDITKYFEEEGLMIHFGYIAKLLRGEKIPKKLPLTLGDLEWAIITKKLV